MTQDSRRSDKKEQRMQTGKSFKGLRRQKAVHEFALTPAEKDAMKLLQKRLGMPLEQLNF